MVSGRGEDIGDFADRKRETDMLIHLDPALVPAQLRQGYSGRAFKAKVCETMTVPADAGLWSGGSRDHYRAIEFSTGRTVLLPGQSEAPWGQRQERKVELKPGFAVICHTIFCGKDLGLTFYVHPANAAAMLPAPQAELSPTERLVLIATRSFKSSYMGRDRYEMMRSKKCDYVMNPPQLPTREAWDAAKASLIGKGLLNKAGAITVSGRNAIGDARE